MLMTIPKDNERRQGKHPVMVIAHRGFSGSAPENTLAAFKKAIALGADMIELDVHLSRDGEVVVIHDDTLDRCTNASGLVADFSLFELKGLDAGTWYSGEFRGETIPSLKEVLTLAKGEILLNIEIKFGYLGPYSMDDLADLTLALVEQAGMLDQVLFSSFYSPALERIKSKNKDAHLALLLNYPWTEADSALIGPYKILNCARDILTRERIISARESGFQINVWTVNDEKKMEWFIKMQVQGIITNYPDRLLKLLKQG